MVAAGLHAPRRGSLRSVSARHNRREERRSLPSYFTRTPRRRRPAQDESPPDGGRERPGGWARRLTAPGTKLPEMPRHGCRHPPTKWTWSERRDLNPHATITLSRPYKSQGIRSDRSGASSGSRTRMCGLEDRRSTVEQRMPWSQARDSDPRGVSPSVYNTDAVAAGPAWRV